MDFFCDGRITLVTLLVWRVPKKIHLMDLGSSLPRLYWCIWTKTEHPNILGSNEKIILVYGKNLKR